MQVVDGTAPHRQLFAPYNRVHGKRTETGGAIMNDEAPSSKSLGDLLINLATQLAEIAGTVRALEERERTRQDALEQLLSNATTWTERLNALVGGTAGASRT